MPKIATADRVELTELLDFVRPRHHMVLVTTKRDGSPQLSPVSGGVDEEGRIVISTYPERAKATNLRRTPRASVMVLSEDWNDAWVQVDGTAEVLDMPSPEAEEGLVEYFRCISGEHPDWEEYRQAMRRQGKSLVRITIDAWGPVATGGFAGLRADGELDLAADDPRVSEVCSLLDRIDVRTLPGGLPQPDRYVYDLDLCGTRATVPEQHLTDDLRRLVRLVLEGRPAG